MKYYSYIQPSDDGANAEVITISELEVIKTYLPYWYENMDSLNRSPNAHTLEDVIQDFKTVNWAYESDAEGNPTKERAHETIPISCISKYNSVI